MSVGSYSPVTASEMYIGWVSRGIGWGLGGLSCLASIILALWVLKNRNERVVRGKRNQRNQSFLSRWLAVMANPFAHLCSFATHLLVDGMLWNIRNGFFHLSVRH
jgi:Na+/melibiose symporter-like transporter